MAELIPFVDVATDAEQMLQLRMNFLDLKHDYNVIQREIRRKSKANENVVDDLLLSETYNQDIDELRQRMKDASELIARQAEKFLARVNLSHWKRFLNFEPDVAVKIILALGKDIASDIEGWLKLRRNFAVLREKLENAEFELEEARASDEDVTALQRVLDSLSEQHENARIELSSATEWIYDRLREEEEFSDSKERTAMIQGIQDTMMGRKRNWPPPPEIRTFPDPKAPQPKVCAQPEANYDDEGFKKPPPPKPLLTARRVKFAESLLDAFGKDFAAHSDKLKQAGTSGASPGKVFICGTELSSNLVDLLALPGKFEKPSSFNVVSSGDQKQYLSTGATPSLGLAAGLIRDNIGKIDERLTKQLVREIFDFFAQNFKFSIAQGEADHLENSRVYQQGTRFELKPISLKRHNYWQCCGSDLPSWFPGFFTVLPDSKTFSPVQVENPDLVLHHAHGSMAPTLTCK